MGGDHIVRSFDRDLDRLTGLISAMGRLAESQLGSATRLFEVYGSILCEQILDADAKLDAMANEVDLLTVQLLVRRQPMANDLRRILSALKIATELERIGDYAASMVRYTIDADLSTVAAILHPIKQMGSLTQSMLSDTMQAYGLSNADKAIAARHRHCDINQIYTGLLGDFRLYVEKSPHKIDALTSMLSIAKCLERIGDHVKNVDEHIYFLVNGEIYNRKALST